MKHVTKSMSFRDTLEHVMINHFEGKQSLLAKGVGIKQPNIARLLDEDPDKRQEMRYGNLANLTANLIARGTQEAKEQAAKLWRAWFLDRLPSHMRPFVRIELDLDHIQNALSSADKAAEIVDSLPDQFQPFAVEFLDMVSKDNIKMDVMKANVQTWR